MVYMFTHLKFHWYQNEQGLFPRGYNIIANEILEYNLDILVSFRLGKAIFGKSLSHLASRYHNEYDITFIWKYIL